MQCPWWTVLLNVTLFIVNQLFIFVAPYLTSALASLSGGPVLACYSPVFHLPSAVFLGDLAAFSNKLSLLAPLRKLVVMIKALTWGGKDTLYSGNWPHAITSSRVLFSKLLEKKKRLMLKWADLALWRAQLLRRAKPRKFLEALWLLYDSACIWHSPS